MTATSFLRDTRRLDFVFLERDVQLVCEVLVCNVPSDVCECRSSQQEKDEVSELCNENVVEKKDAIITENKFLRSPPAKSSSTPIY